MQDDAAIEMVWMAVSAMDTESNIVNVRLRDLIFATPSS